MKKLSQEKKNTIASMIPFAEAHADKVVKLERKSSNYDIDAARWNVAYHEEMDSLCKAEGVRF